MLVPRRFARPVAGEQYGRGQAHESSIGEVVLDGRGQLGCGNGFGKATLLPARFSSWLGGSGHGLDIRGSRLFRLRRDDGFYSPPSFGDQMTMSGDGKLPLRARAAQADRAGREFAGLFALWAIWRSKRPIWRTGLAPSALAGCLFLDRLGWGFDLVSRGAPRGGSGVWSSMLRTVIPIGNRPLCRGAAYTGRRTTADTDGEAMEQDGCGERGGRLSRFQRFSPKSVIVREGAINRRTPSPATSHVSHSL